jgi:hypothetical protein
MTSAEQLFWSEVATLLRSLHAVVDGLEPMLTAYAPVLMITAVLAFGLVLLAELAQRMVIPPRGKPSPIR